MRYNTTATGPYLEAAMERDFIACYDELLSCIPTEAEVEEIETGQDIVDRFNGRGYGHLVFNHLSILASDIATHDDNRFQAPATPCYALTELAVRSQRECRLELALQPEGEACFQAELRTRRSIDRHLARRGQRKARHLPAAVLLDTDGEPFAYQKADGMASVIAWRDADYQTEQGIQHVLGGMLLFLNYGQQVARAPHDAEDPRIDLTNADTPDLIVLDPEKHRPRSVKLYRFLTSCLTPALRAAAVEEGIHLGLHPPKQARGSHMATTDLGPYRSAARNFSCNSFAADVHGLIAAHKPPIL